MEEAKKELSDAFAMYKILIKPKKLSDLRDEWFENLAAAKAAANNTSLASELTSKRQRKKQRQAFRSIKLTLCGTEADFSITQVYETIIGQELLRSTKEDVKLAIVKVNDQSIAKLTIYQQCQHCSLI